jgi:hypothetical protein
MNSPLAMAEVGVSTQILGDGISERSHPCLTMLATKPLAQVSTSWRVVQPV